MTVESDGIEARIREVLKAYATDSLENQGLHGWRCKYPDAYGNGPCTCFEKLVKDLVESVTATGGNVEDVTRIRP